MQLFPSYLSLFGENYNLFPYLDDMIKIAIQNHQWDILESIYKYKKLQDELFDSCANGNLAKLEDLILNHSASPGDGGNMCLGIESGRSEHAWIKISVRSPLIYLNWLNLTY